jgi:hypothetical protein
MNAAPVLCPRCSNLLPSLMLNGRPDLPCSSCGSQLTVRAFQALIRVAERSAVGERVTDAGQAACFYHPHKTAHVPCDACGRFICALCDVELHGQHLCPSCIESGRRKGTLTTFENRRLLWDNIALSTAVLPVVTLFFWFLTIITAPAALLLAVMGWRKPGSLAPRTKIRFVIAIGFSLLVLAGWAALFYFLATEQNPFEILVTEQ